MLTANMIRNLHIVNSGFTKDEVEEILKLLPFFEGENRGYRDGIGTSLLRVLPKEEDLGRLTYTEAKPHVVDLKSEGFDWSSEKALNLAILLCTLPKKDSIIALASKDSYIRGWITGLMSSSPLK
eukprot:TRINITY_DN68458_c0_g1_i1.p1 TRINITY_DN68458_c0_g1~~TRINITY_DN68458_c0_g1_i1.p1  ORF type:complete len:125 (-),score=0.33 TRINITY_DN68458_c0_g1_i1:24-398(-)